MPENEEGVVDGCDSDSSGVGGEVWGVIDGGQRW